MIQRLERAIQHQDRATRYQDAREAWKAMNSALFATQELMIQSCPHQVMQSSILELLRGAISGARGNDEVGAAAFSIMACVKLFAQYGDWLRREETERLREERGFRAGGGFKREDQMVEDDDAS